jgi:hypothetical protein
MTTTCPTKHDAAAIKRAAESALGAASLELIAPLLPDPWPKPVSVTFYTYYELPLPTGEVAYSIEGPARHVEFESLEKPPNIVRFKRPKSLGREEDSYFGHQLPSREVLLAAEEVLLEVVLGCQTPEAALPRLEPYREWFSMHPPVAKDLRKRLPAFMKWLFSVWPASEFPKP